MARCFEMRVIVEPRWIKINRIPLRRHLYTTRWYLTLFMHPPTAAVDLLPQRHNPSRFAYSLSPYTVIVDENITALVNSKGRKNPSSLFPVLINTILEPLQSFEVESSHAFLQQSELVKGITDELSPSSRREASSRVKDEIPYSHHPAAV